ncbi:MAG TPA: hypothetical protein PLD25_30375 [Chloroflexota bacterium]|nr:hypothetical protein [Chloroflexota bacterium]HUM67995.1 hypothetical protein [Chloroflexota bacterium]
MNYASFRLQAIEFMLDRGWKEKKAKSKQFEQSLFDHTLIEIDAFIALLPLLRNTFDPSLTEQEEQVLLTSTLAHDVGKELDEWQKYIKGQRGFLSDVNRELTERVVPQLAAMFGFSHVEEMLSSVLLHMRNERTDANVMERVLFGGHANPRWKTLADLVDTVDNLCSIKGLFAARDYLESRNILSRHIQTAYHLVQLRGVSTTLLHLAAIESFTEAGWQPLLHYSNGTLYISSTTTNLHEPTSTEVESRLGEAIERVVPSNMAELIVGSPIATMIPKVDLFDYRDLRACLHTAARRINRSNFPKKPEPVRRKVISDYLQLKNENDPVTFTTDVLASQTERIGTAQPEMCVFKFFKAALSDELLGKTVLPESEQLYAAFVEGGGKNKPAQVTPQSVARVEYDKVFGSGAYDDLQRTATLMPARDMAFTVDRFWSLYGSQFDIGNIAKIEHLLDHNKREAILIQTLVTIAEKVYAAVPESNRPKRTAPPEIAQKFMVDLIYPSPKWNLAGLAQVQLQANTDTKVNARTAKGWHLCPICNQAFEGGTEAKADFIDKPDAHTNRAPSHGRSGKIIICDACKFERFLQQLILGSQVSDMIVLFPRMNIGHGSGEILKRKVSEIWDRALVRMSDENPDPDAHLSLGLIFYPAREMANRDVFHLSPAEIVDLITYRSSKDTAKKHRRELEKSLKEIYEVDDLTVDVLNEMWETIFTTKDEAIEALLHNKITDDDARQAVKTAFRLTPEFHIACQTPHMILVPLKNPISVGKESDTNSGIRELYISLILGLALDCSVAVMKTGEVITFEGGEGIARVPPIPALRELIGSEWVPIVAAKKPSAKKWLEAIGAAALLANDTAFPERSNLYAILKSPTAGHILRRIEQKSDSGQATMRHIRLLQTLKEVLQ